MLRDASVEVRKSAKSQTWYNAVLLDIVGSTHVKVGFEDNIWPNRDVLSHLVRPCPEEGENDDFHPMVDDIVEVFANATDTNPSGWAQGRVTNIKESFYFIGLAGEKDSQKIARDTIVERSALRPLSTQLPIDLTGISRRSVAVDPELSSWVQTQDSAGCLKHVQESAKLLLASVATAGGSPEVRLVGNEACVDLAEKLLVQIHFPYQLEMQRWHENRAYFAQHLQEMQSWYCAQYQETFIVDSSLVGKIIGKKGENINNIRQCHDVEIEIWDSTDGQATTTVKVSGDTSEQVKAAREKLEYKVVKIPISGDQIGWVLGKGRQNLTDIAKKAELHYARFDDHTSSVEICGLQHQVETAKILINVHKEYLPVYKDMDQETNAIQTCFEELEGPGHMGKGRGGKKGGGNKGGWPRKP